MDGSNRTEFAPLATSGGAYSVAVDWVSRNLFWGNVKTSTIEVIRLDGGENHRKVVLGSNNNATGVSQPVAMAVDPVAGYVYLHCVL